MQDFQHHDNNILLLLLGAITGLIGLSANDLDLVLSICLKLVSIFSFLVVIIINVPKLLEVLKSLWKK